MATGSFPVEIVPIGTECAINLASFQWNELKQSGPFIYSPLTPTPIMHTTSDCPAAPNLFRVSLLAWRANYQASKSLDQNGAVAQGAPPRNTRRRRPMALSAVKGASRV